MDNPATYSFEISSSGDTEIDVIAAIRLMMSRSLNDEERTRVVNYLHQRYG